MRNERLDFLKCLCAIFVIMHHSISHISREYHCLFPEWFDIITSPIYAHVSIFFVIAGYLCHEQSLEKFFVKKFNRILLPFFFFSLSKILYTLILSSQFAHSESIAGMFFDAFVFGRLYWFSYCIFLFYCTAPLLWKGARKSKAFPFSLLLALLGICGIISWTKCIPIDPTIFQIGHALWYMPYFLVGFILQLYRNEASSCLKTVNKFHLTPVFAVAYMVGYYLDEHLGLQPEYLLMFVQRMSALVVFYNLAGLFKRNIVVDKVSKYSYQIMLIDSFSRVAILQLINRLFGVSVGWMIPQTALSVLACVLVCELCSRWKVTRYLIGL